MPIEPLEAEHAFMSNDPDRICNALVSIALFAKDWQWAQSKCLHFLNDQNSTISGLSATCLGHIARVHGKLDKQKVISALKGHLDNPEISSRIEDAIEDIERFA